MKYACPYNGAIPPTYILLESGDIPNQSSSHEVVRNRAEHFMFGAAIFLGDWKQPPNF